MNEAEQARVYLKMTRSRRPQRIHKIRHSTDGLYSDVNDNEITDKRDESLRYIFLKEQT